MGELSHETLKIFSMWVCLGRVEGVRGKGTDLETPAHTEFLMIL